MKRTITALTAMLIACGVCVGFTQADAQPVKETTFKVAPNDVTNWAAIERMDHEAAKLHAAQAIDSWQRMIAAEQEEAEEEYYEPEEWYEPVYYEASYSGYSGGSTATTLTDLLNGQGRAYDESGTSYTYYVNVCGDLDIPGEHKDADGVSYDKDDYIVVAADGYGYGDIVDTPYGQGRVYDHGAGWGNIDIYVG